MAHDHIIFRDGSERDVKLYQVTDARIVFGPADAKGVITEEVPSSDVYMVYIEQHGNVYVLPDGKRVSGESQRADPKKQDVIYLVKGAEIGVDNVAVSDDMVNFSMKKKKGGMSGLFGKTTVSEGAFEKSDVFMIRYRSGMVDIITPIIAAPEPVQPVDTVPEAPKQPQFTVVFHAVVKGETLDKIASAYNVTPAQIIEWNDLSPRTKKSALLAAGTQLMIYQPKE